LIGVVGEALIDLVVAESDPSRPVAHPGGSPMNVAVTLGRLESPVAFLGRLSGDAFGDLLRGHLESSGVDLRWSVDAREPTSLAVVSVAPGGGAGYSFHVHRTADWQWTPAELAAAPGFDSIHAGSLGLALEPGGPVVEAWLEGLKGSTTISLDPNVRPELLGDRDRYRCGRLLQRRSAPLAGPGRPAPARPTGEPDRRRSPRRGRVRLRGRRRHLLPRRGESAAPQRIGGLVLGSGRRPQGIATRAPTSTPSISESATAIRPTAQTRPLRASRPQPAESQALTRSRRPGKRASRSASRTVLRRSRPTWR
jgi:hypothetical protein